MSDTFVTEGPSGREDDLQDARERWESVGPRAYRTVVTRRCFCPPDAIGPVVVTVASSGVTRSYQDRPADLIPAEMVEGFPTVEEAFDLIQEAFDRDAHEVEVRYDPDTGAPLDVYIDQIEHAIDEEMRYELTPPEALPEG